MYSTHGSRDGWSSVPVDASPEHQELAQLQEQIVQLQRETSPDTTQRESSEVEQPERQAEQDGFLQGIAQQADGVPVFPLEKLIGQDFSSVVAAIEQLDPQMELSRTDELTNALVLLGEKSPRDVVQCIALLQGNENDSETSAHFRLFRKLDKQPQLSPCGNWHYLRKPIDTVLGWAVSASIDGTSDAPWDEYLGEGFQIPAHEKYESEKCERQVLMLAGFSAMPSDSEGSPYARLFRALEKLPEQQLNALISTDLMATTTEFKWNAFARRLLLGKLVRFMAHFLLAGVGMVMSTQSAGKEKDGTLNAADILVLCLLFTNSTMLYHEVRQMRLDGFPVYLSDGWNLCDLSGIVALYTACVAHWLNHASMVESVGSVGLLFNCFSVLPLLMPFRMTGLLVRTFVGMMSNPDINGFFVVSAIMVWGFAMAFAVSMPKSEALFGDAGGGPLVSVLTAFEAMLGAFHLSNYQGQTLAYFLLFLFVSHFPSASVRSFVARLFHPQN